MYIYMYMKVIKQPNRYCTYWLQLPLPPFPDPPPLNWQAQPLMHVHVYICIHVHVTCMYIGEEVGVRVYVNLSLVCTGPN